MKEKIKILLVTYFPLRDDLSTGNTLINVFNGIEGNYEFANIYIKDGNPNNNMVNNYFHISERKLIKSIFTRKSVYSSECILNSENNIDNSQLYNKARQLRWDSLLFVQDIVGLLGKWKTEELDEFVINFNPDIIFGPLGRVPLPNVIMNYIHNKFNVKMVTFAWDDHYSLHKIALSPFFWMRTLFERKYIKQCVDGCTSLFTITSLMKKEYEKSFNRECNIINKSYHFLAMPEYTADKQKQISITYLGNVGAGRIQTIKKVAMAIDSINKKDINVKFDIYTATPLSRKIVKKIGACNGVTINKAVSQTQLKKIMADSDILLYVTPIRKKERLLERLSFSTKLVDYFYFAKCIFCVGGETAVTRYLEENDAAIVVHDLDKITISLESLIRDSEKIKKYAQNAWICGENNHQKDKSQKLILSVLNK